jgi:membrane fusion protein, multidrug efflux system
MKRIILILTVIFILGAFIACGPEAESAGKESPKAENSDNNGNTGAALLVSVQNMAYQKFEHFFEANGSVEAVKEAFVSPELNGQIKKIHVKEGQRVKEGQLMVSLNSDVIESSIAEVKSSLELARTVYKKRKGLWEKKIGSEIQYLESKTNRDSLENRLKSLQAQLRMSRIKAPISGIVDKIYRKEGELAVPGMQLLQLVNLKNVYINAEVSESYIGKVVKDDIVTLSFPSYPEKILEAKVYRTGNVVNITNRTFLVQLLMENSEETLKPNMMALLKIRDYVADAALVVPSVIIKKDVKGAYLYVAEKDQEDKGKTVARKIYVKTGKSEAGKTMILDGLKPGKKVVVNGYNLVKNGMEVKIEG